MSCHGEISFPPCQNKEDSAPSSLLECEHRIHFAPQIMQRYGETNMVGFFDCRPNIHLSLTFDRGGGNHCSAIGLTDSCIRSRNNGSASEPFFTDAVTGVSSLVVGSPSIDMNAAGNAKPISKSPRTPKPSHNRPRPANHRREQAHAVGPGTNNDTHLVEERTVVHAVFLALDLQVVPLGLRQQNASSHTSQVKRHTLVAPTFVTPFPQLKYNE